MKIKEMTEDSRPRERLLKFGIKNLSDSELLALVLEKGTKQENVIEMSSRLITKYGLDKLSECSLKELQEINGIGQVKAMQILALFEFNKRHNMSKKPIKKISCAEDVFDLYHERLKDEKQENFIILMLNHMNNIVGEQLIAKGSLDSATTNPREIFKPAIKNSSGRIILVHNHPSGNIHPSEQDIELTEKLFESGKLLGIDIIDHIIVGNEKFWSWKNK